MHFTALKSFVFYYSPPHIFQSEKHRLTWDGKCEEFSVLFSLTQAQRGYSGFQVTGMMEWGQKSKPKKIPLPKFIPQKIPCRISEPYQKFPESIKWCNTTNINISFECPKRSLIKSSYQKKYLPKFSYPKNPEIENLKPKKCFLHPCHLKSGVPAQPPPPRPLLGIQVTKSSKIH